MNKKNNASGASKPAARKAAAHGGDARKIDARGGGAQKAAMFADAQGGAGDSKRLCPVERECGACQTVSVPYERQLEDKQAYIEGLFGRKALPILGMDDPFHYRNKVVSPYAPGGKVSSGRGVRDRRASGSSAKDSRAGRAERRSSKSRGANAAVEILTGMYAAGTHRLVPVDDCLLENKTAKSVTLAVRDIMRRYGIAPYNEDTGEGFMRHAVVRVGHESGEVLVTLVTNSREFPSSKSFCRELVRRCPAVTTVVQNVNLRKTNVILGDEEHTLYGPGFILDTLCGLSFRISSKSFYQVNAVQTEVLYRTAIGMAGLTGTETVIDAYCGTGTIGLVAARGIDALVIEGREFGGSAGAARVIGVDSVEQAIRDAAQNARHNGVENAEFVAADASAFMRRLAADESFDSDKLVLFMDPPRAGSTEEFLDVAVKLAPARIVYISCNPETQVRDVRYLEERGYALERIQPVDMFPHTSHVESVVLLSWTGGRE